VIFLVAVKSSLKFADRKLLLGMLFRLNIAAPRTSENMVRATMRDLLISAVF